MAPERISQKDIARTLGITQATVSMALAGNPRISPELREKVRETADTLNYIPDPGLRALSRYRRRKNPGQFHATLAWLHNQTSEFWWRDSAVFRIIHDAARLQAEKLGYHLENVLANTDTMSPARITGILRARGIKGIILLPCFHQAPILDLDWEHFAVVRLMDAHQGCSRMHLVGADHYTAVSEALKEGFDRGYTRPGLITSTLIETANLNQYSSAYLGLKQLHRGRKWAPILEIDKHPGQQVEAWMDEYKPDLILCSYLDIHLDPILQTLQKLRKIPNEAGVIMLCMPDPTRTHHHGLNLSGIDEDFTDIGRRTVNLLVNLAEEFEYGLSPRPIRHLVSGDWVEGGTLR